MVKAKEQRVEVKLDFASILTITWSLSLDKPIIRK